MVGLLERLRLPVLPLRRSTDAPKLSRRERRRARRQRRKLLRAVKDFTG